MVEDGRALSGDDWLRNRKILITALRVMDGTLSPEKGERTIAYMAKTDAVLARTLLGELVKLDREKLVASIGDLSLPERIIEKRREAFIIPRPTRAGAPRVGAAPPHSAQPQGS